MTWGAPSEQWYPVFGPFWLQGWMPANTSSRIRVLKSRLQGPKIMWVKQAILEEKEGLWTLKHRSHMKQQEYSFFIQSNMLAFFLDYLVLSIYLLLFCVRNDDGNFSAVREPTVKSIALTSSRWHTASGLRKWQNGGVWQSEKHKLHQKDNLHLVYNKK